MKLSYSCVLALHCLGVLARPSPNRANNDRVSNTTTSAAVTTTTAASGAGKEGEAENEVEQTGQFGVKINLGGGDIKTDSVFPPGQNGALEVEFQNQAARVLTVKENTSPAAAPPGFVALEPVSYVVELEGGTQGLTLQKIDYIRNANSTTDISKGVLGRLCAETKTFAVVAETEFEADENELTAPVDSLVGEFAFFVPDAAGGAIDGEAEASGGAAAGNGAPTAADLLAQLLGLLSGTAGGK